MKVVILAGGKGTRIHEESKNKPKPMINIAGRPIILYIMKCFIKYNFTEFIVAGGYKSNQIRKFFKHKRNYNVTVVNTGLNTMTAGRILRLKKYLAGEENFFLTYGDGISDVNLSRLSKFHLKKNSVCTLTAIKPKLRFGIVNFKRNNMISEFTEKPSKGFSNGGFMVMNKNIFNYIRNDKSILEENILPKLAKKNKLSGFKHTGFWKCVDNMKDKLEIVKIIKQKKFLWLKKI